MSTQIYESAVVETQEFGSDKITRQKMVMCNRYANAARRKRQEKSRKPQQNSPPAPAPQLNELIDNLNWLIGSIRRGAESESARTILDRFVRLATSACIIDGLTLDSNGWAALLNLANGRSFSAMKNRRRIQALKPGQTLMFSAADLLDAAARSRERPQQNASEERGTK